MKFFIERLYWLGFQKMNENNILIICGGSEEAESLIIRNDNLATLHVLDGIRSKSSKYSTTISNPFILTINQNRTKTLLHKHINLPQKGDCSIPAEIECICSKGGYLISGSSDGILRIWRDSNGELLIEQNLHIGPITCLYIDITFWILYAASSTGRIGSWCIPDLFHSSEPDQIWSNHSLTVNDFIISTGNRVYSVSDDKTLKCYDHISSCEILSLSFPEVLTTICLSNNESIIYCGSISGKIYLIPIINEISINNELIGHKLSITDIIISSDDRSLYSSSLDNSIRRWDTSSGQCIFNVDLQYTPYSLNWLIQNNEITKDINIEKKRKTKAEAKNNKLKLGFPRLQRNINGNFDDIVVAPVKEIPIISIEEETIIAINDITRNKIMNLDIIQLK